MRLLGLVVLLVVGVPVAPAWAQEWRWPLDGPPAVARPFTPPAHRYAAGHRGADLPAVPGAPVRAVGDGVVSYAGLVAGRGVVVVVHGALRTTYEPVSALLGVGSLVGAGEVVGTLDPGHAGCPVAACLHWGLRRGEDYLDPVRLVAPGPVRLLPLDGPAPGGALRETAAAPARPALRWSDGSASGGTAGADPAAAAARAEPAAAAAAAEPAAAAAAAEPAAAAERRSPETSLAAAAAVSVLGAAAVAGARRRRG